MIPKNETLPKQSPGTGPTTSRWVSAVSCGWLFLAAISLIFLYNRILHMSLDGAVHSWASANCMTQARSFFVLGPWRTHFVPVQNNLPLGLDPDVYLHWPPLVPLVIAFFMRIFGDTPAAGWIVEMLVSLSTAGLLVFLGKSLSNLRVGVLAGFFFLTAAATYNGGRTIVQPPMAVMFSVAAVFCATLAMRGQRLHKAWLAIGVICAACMVLASWDTLFMPIGLLLAALYGRDRAATKLAAAYLAAAVFAFAVIQADYLVNYPAFFGDLASTVGYRLGFPFKPPTSIPLHSIVDRASYHSQISFATSIVYQATNLLDSFHPFVLFAGCLFLAFCRPRSLREDRKQQLILGGLFLPWLLWAIVMHQYMGIHEFTLVLATPFLAMATALVFDRLLRILEGQREGRAALWVTVLVLPALVFYGAGEASAHAKRRFAKPEFSDLSSLIERNTPPNAVVLSPVESSEPVYDSRRHVVRGIDSPELLRQATAEAHAAFPGSPLYLAVQSGDRAGLEGVLADWKPLATQGDSAIYTLP